jgi:hypothetical protein
MKKSQKIKRLEAAFKDNFNASSTMTMSSEWDANLLERLRQLEPIQLSQKKTSSKFERNIWCLSWVTFTVSAAAAIVFGVYIYTQNNNFDAELDNNIYTSLAMLD